MKLRCVLNNNTWRSIVVKLIFVALWFSFLHMNDGYATTLLYKNFNDLINESDGIVLGTVNNVESHYSPDREIYTFVTLKQLNIICGRYSQDTLVIRLKGGQVENEVLTVEGSPQFNPGDRVVLFLKRNGYNIVPIVGWTQGVFRVINDKTTGTEVIHDYQGNRVYGIEGKNILKENLHLPGAYIIDQVHGSDISMEVITDISNSSIPSIETQNHQKPSIPNQKAMMATEFLNVLHQRIANKTKKARLIKSVKVLDFSTGLSKLDCVPERSETIYNAVTPNIEQDKPVLPKAYQERQIIQEDQ